MPSEGSRPRSGGGDTVLRYVDHLLPRRPPLRVAILCRSSGSQALKQYVAALDGHEVHLVLPGTQAASLPGVAACHLADDLEAIDEALSEVGPFDLVVNLWADSADAHGDSWGHLFFQLSEGGAYVLVRRAIRQSKTTPTVVPDRIWKVQSVVAGAAEASSLPAVDRELVTCARRLLLDPKVIVIEKARQRHYLKVRDEEALDLLPKRLRRTSVRALTTLPAGSLRTSGTVTSYRSDVPIRGLDTELPYPSLQLRDYRGRIGMASHQLLFTERCVLPESFRQHAVATVVHPTIPNASKRWASIPATMRPTRRLAGSYYHLDSQFSGHFGHVMSEVVSRLWGWDAAKAAYPGLKAIFFTPPGKPGPPLEQRVLSAYGISPEDIVSTSEPVWLEHVIGATPMWHNQVPHYVHPGLRDVWARLAAGMIDPAVPGIPRIFVSRRMVGWRQCHNTADVEAFFRAHGFEVVYPEQLELTHQAGLFAQAEVIAGFGGSALYNMVYAQRARTMIVLNHEAYTARGEHLFSTAHGCDAHYFWSRPDIPHPEGGWSGQANVSPWTFDFDRNGRQLERLLSTLA